MAAIYAEKYQPHFTLHSNGYVFSSNVCNGCVFSSNVCI